MVRALQQGLEEMLIDAAQLGQVQPRTEIMKHPDIGQVALVAQAGKGSPGPMFGQQFGQKVERTRRGEQWQQRDAKQLGGGEMNRSSRP